MERDVMVVRIYLSEADQGRRTTLVREIFSRLHDTHQVRGLTVFRGIAGFGSSGEVHSADLLRWTADLPLVIEFFDEPERVEAALAAIAALLPAGHVLRWPARCLCAT